MKISLGSGLTNLTILYAIGNFGSKAMSFLLVFVLTYFLSKEEVGEFDIIFTSLTLIVPVLTLSIEFSLFRWMAVATSLDESQKLLRNVFGILFISIGCFGLLYWVVIPFVNIRSEHTLPIFLYGLSMILYPSLLQGTRAAGRNKLFVWAGLMFSILNVSTTLGLLYFTDLKIVGVLYGNAVSYFLISFFLIFKNGWFDNIRFSALNKAICSDLLRYSLPLIPNTISWWLINYAVRFVILYYLGQGQNGIFSIANKYAAVVLIFTDVFSLAWQDKLIRMKGDSSAYFSEIFERYCKIIFGVLMVLSSLSSTLMGLLEDSFYEAWIYVPILLLAVALQGFSGFLGAAFLALKKTKVLLLSSLAGGVVSILASFTLIRFGLVGVSASIVLGFLSLFAVRWSFLIRMMDVRFPSYWFTVLLVVYVGISCINYLENPLWSSLSIVLSILVNCLINREVILSKIIKKMS